MIDRQKLEALFESARSLSVLVVGDVMLDEYVWGNVRRISPEAPVQVVEVTREEARLGGAGNVANNILPFGCSVALCSTVGDDDTASSFASLLDGRVECSGIFRDAGRPTIRKTRVLASNQQMIRIDRESRRPLSPSSETQLIEYLKANIDRHDLLLLSDYGKGVLTEGVLGAAIALGRERGIPVLVDPKGTDYARYRGATLLTPNRKELETVCGAELDTEEKLVAAGLKLLSDLDLQALLVTRSEKGMSLFTPPRNHLHLPTTAREVFDVTGAGDTVVAVLGVALALKLDLAEAAGIANTAAGIVVGKVGTSVATPAEIVAEISRGVHDSTEKIKEPEVLRRILEAAKNRGRRVVFTNGCFDLLHVGHVRYLQKAKNLGDVLVLGLNSDASVRRLKGESRPVIAETERAHLLAALDCIDFVTIFDEDTPLDLIRTLRPHILVKGGDYSPEGVVGREVVEAEGGRVEIIDFVDGKSTSGIIDRILSSNG